MTENDERNREVKSFKKKIIVGLVVIACIQIAVVVLIRIYN